MENLIGLFVGVDGIVSIKVIENSAVALRDLIGCRCLDITSRYIGGKLFYIVCDDEFLLNGSEPTAYYMDGTLAFAGNIFILNFDGIDDVCSLEVLDIVNIFRYVSFGHLFLDCF